MLFSRLFRKPQPNLEGKLNFIDVGSAGLLPSPWDDNLGCIDTTLKFEPRDASEEVEGVIFSDQALWNSRCERDFYIYAGFNGTGSSLFRQNFGYVRENFDVIRERGPANLAASWADRGKLIRTEKISCTTLDNVLASLKPKRRFDFLKVDAQGAEFQILEGGSKFISEDCQGMVLELFTIPLYEGIKLADEVIELLDQKGFDLVKRLPPHGTFDSQNDCLFLRRDIRPGANKIIRTVYGL